ncbi:MAG TPA: hypothetical protein VFS43_42100 [Polyangiaceae bacterium]|nr:hypothetical protein [Polyangiaceae bacterium]
MTAPEPLPTDALVALPCARDAVPPVLQVRTTLLTSSLDALREHGFADRYFDHLPAGHHATMRSLVAGQWAPVELALTHYRACDAMGLGPDELERVAAGVGHRVRGTFLGALVRASQAVGVTPWTALGHYGRVWGRLFLGGAPAVFRLGPSEAQLELHGLPLCGISYCRESVHHLHSGVLLLFCKRLHFREVPRLCGPTSLAARVRWG